MIDQETDVERWWDDLEERAVGAILDAERAGLVATAAEMRLEAHKVGRLISTIRQQETVLRELRAAIRSTPDLDGSQEWTELLERIDDVLSD